EPRCTTQSPSASWIMARPLAIWTRRKLTRSAGKGCSDAGTARACSASAGTVAVGNWSRAIRGTSSVLKGWRTSEGWKASEEGRSAERYPSNTNFWTPNLSWLKKVYQGNSAQVSPRVTPSAPTTRSPPSRFFFFFFFAATGTGRLPARTGAAERAGAFLFHG